MPASRRLGVTLIVVAMLFVTLQLVPYGRAHTNPPDGARVAFADAGTEALARQACFDCHSNHTRWPWYSSIAPVSWRIQSHVIEGRLKLNFTAFDAASEDMADAAGEAAEAVSKGEMPPADYRLAHPEARLSAAERKMLADGLGRSFAAYSENGSGHDRHDEDRDHAP